MTEVVKVNEPSFTPYQYNLSNKSLLQRLKFLFKNPPRLRLHHDFTFDLSDGTTIVVPANFVSDGASVPRWFWAIPGFSPYGALLHGGLPHDFAYQYGYLLAIYDPYKDYPEISKKYRIVYSHIFPENTIPIFVNKPQHLFDRILLEVCRKASPSYRFVPLVAYKMLLLFGHHAWSKYRNCGPKAYGAYNTLGYPGVNHNGVIF